MNNNLTFQFGMYEPATDSIIVNTGENSILVIRCKECNSSVTFDEPSAAAAKLLKVEIKTASRLLLKAEKLNILKGAGKTKNKVYFRE